MAKIYVSSTFSDLESYRADVERVLLREHHYVFSMESYVASDQRPLEKCLSDVAECDLYIGIFAWHYGYIPEEGNPEGKSITELEYRKAAELGISRLIFLLDEDAEWRPRFVDKGEDGERILHLRQELCKKHVVSFFKTGDELATLVGTAVRLGLKDEPPKPSSSQYNLPKPVESFVPRQDRLELTLKALNPGTRSWGAAIQGDGGVGKTSMAIEVAHHYVDKKSFEKIIWTTAQTQPLRLENELISVVGGDCFVEFGGLLDEIIFAFDSKFNSRPIDEKTRLAKAYLGSARCLLIVDNLETINDYEPIADFLMSAPASTKIITTARPDTKQLGTGEILVKLSPMSFEESERLIRNLCERREIDMADAHVQKLLKFTGGIPLAINWSLGQFKRSADEIDRFLAKLLRMSSTGVFDRETGLLLEFCFGEAFAALSEPSQDVLSILGLIDAPLREVELIEVCGLGHNGYKAAREEILHAFSLVIEQRDKGGEALKLLPLTRSFIRRELSGRGDYKNYVRRKYADFVFSHRKGFICAFTPMDKPIILPADATPLDFAYHVHSEVGNSFEGAIVDSKPADVSLPITNGAVVEVIVGKHEYRPKEFKFAHTKRAQSAIREWNSRPYRAASVVSRGNAYSLRCEMVDAKAEYELAIRLGGDLPWAYNRLGHLLRLEGETEEASKCFRGILKLRSNDQYGLSGLAAIHYQQGGVEDALRLYEKALASEGSYENAIFGAARCRCTLHQYEEADKLLVELLNVSARRKRGLHGRMPKRRLAIVYLFRMIAKAGMGDTHHAVAQLDQALRRFSSIVPEVRLNLPHHHGSHLLYYYSIALACASSVKYERFLERAAQVCSLPGLSAELLADIRLFKDNLMRPVENVVMLKFPEGTVVDKINSVRLRLQGLSNR